VLYLVLGLVLAALGLLIVALTTANTLFAWISVTVSVLAAGSLVVDWLYGRRRARDAAEEAEPDPVLARPDEPFGDQAPPLTEKRRPGASRADRRAVSAPPDSPRPELAEAGTGSTRADVLEQAASERAQSERAAPEEAAEPEAARPEVARPEVARPEVARPEVARPEVAEPEVAEPARREVSRAEPVVDDPAEAESATAEPVQAEPAAAEPVQAEPPAVERAAAEPAAAEPADEKRAGEERGREAVLSGRRAQEARRDIVDEHGEPVEEPTDATDLLIVTDLQAEVRVVDEHPRYHLMTCTFLLDKPTLPLPVAEARQLGFTPCIRCSPDATLAARHRATR
jgi:hypothetical protein